MPDPTRKQGFVKVNINIQPELLGAYKRLGDVAGVPYSTLMRDALMDNVRDTARKHLSRVQEEQAMLKDLEQVAEM